MSTLTFLITLPPSPAAASHPFHEHTLRDRLVPQTRDERALRSGANLEGIETLAQMSDAERVVKALIAEYMHCPSSDWF